MAARITIAVARELLAHYGTQAAALVDKRAQENIRAGEEEGATFWRQVAEALRALEYTSEDGRAQSFR
jgi:L-asparaginase II